MDAILTDQATAEAALVKVRDNLIKARDDYQAKHDALKALLIDIRPRGLLTVNEMAEAAGRDRNFVDRLWSGTGQTTKGKQTRVQVAENTDAYEARDAYEAIKEAAYSRQRALKIYDTALAERNRVVAMVYRSELLGGPSPLARLAGIDRNHIGRIARKAGIPPVHRPGTKNQYTSA